MKYICLLLALLFAEFADAAPIENCSADISKALEPFKSKKDPSALVRYDVIKSVNYIDKGSMPGLDWRHIYGVRFIDFDYDGDFDVVFDMQDYNYLMPHIYAVAGEINQSLMLEVLKNPRSETAKGIISAYIKNIPDNNEALARFLADNEVVRMDDLTSFVSGVDLAYREFFLVNGKYHILAPLSGKKNEGLHYVYALGGRKLSSVCQYQSK